MGTNGMTRKVLFENVCWAKEHLEPVKPQYCIVWTRPADGGTSVTHPSGEWMAMAMHGGLLPEIDAYHNLRCEWTHDKTGEKCLTLVNESPGPDWSGGVVTNGYLLHSGPWAPAMTEEEAMEYLLQKDVPRAVWADHDRANFPRFRIVRRDALPKTRAFRNAWALNPNLELEAA